jgi:hypothetical protein
MRVPLYLSSLLFIAFRLFSYFCRTVRFLLSFTAALLELRNSAEHFCCRVAAGSAVSEQHERAGGGAAWGGSFCVGVGRAAGGGRSSRRRERNSSAGMFVRSRCSSSLWCAFFRVIASSFRRTTSSCGLCAVVFVSFSCYAPLLFFCAVFRAFSLLYCCAVRVCVAFCVPVAPHSLPLP